MSPSLPRVAIWPHLQASTSWTGSFKSCSPIRTSIYDVLVPTDVLTAVYFDGGAATFTPLSATLTSGSTAYLGPDDCGNVGSGWAYASGLSGAPGGATQGISSTGLDLFGNANFGGAYLDGPTAVDRLNYGILSAGDNTSTGNQAVTGGGVNVVPLIKNSVTLLLSGRPVGFALSDIGNV
jgi:hypothetical protein